MTETPAPGDDYEPNDDFAEAALILVGQTVRAGIVQDDVDFFRLYAKAGATYRCDVTPDGFDSELVLYDEFRSEIGRNDDRAPGDPGSGLSWRTEYASWVYLRVGALVDQIPTGEGTYTLHCAVLPPTPTPTPPATSTPTMTPTPYDPYEPNYTFDLAADMVVGTPVQAVIAAGDNDYYRLYTKAGNTYRCDVTPQGFDSNLIVYDQNRAGIGGSDDRSPADIGSSLSWGAAYTGWAYLLVGPVSGTGPYTLLCTVVLPTATPTFAPLTPAPSATLHVIPTATPLPGDDGGTPSPATSPPQASSSQVVMTPTPDFTPTPAVVFHVSVLLYYDHNDNEAPEPEEGIRGASVVLIAPQTNKPLVQAFSDDTGSVYLSHAGFEVARVAVPFLGFSKQVRSGEHLVVRIKPQRLPGLLP
jgi:hypothetical protein